MYQCHSRASGKNRDMCVLHWIYCTRTLAETRVQSVLSSKTHDVTNIAQSGSLIRLMVRPLPKEIQDWLKRCIHWSYTRRHHDMGQFWESLTLYDGNKAVNSNSGSVILICSILFLICFNKLLDKRLLMLLVIWLTLAVTWRQCNGQRECINVRL